MDEKLAVVLEDPELGNFPLLFWTAMQQKCSKTHNDRAKVFCSLYLLFGDVLAAVVTVVCLSFLALRSLDGDAENNVD